MPAPLTERAVRDLMLTKLAGSLLDARDCLTLKLVPYTAATVRTLKLTVPAACFKIPYFALDGRPTSFFRVRYMEDTRKGFDALTGKKAMRYAQPSETVSEVYLPPLVDWTKLAPNADIPLLITEGELKAACATKHGLPTMGLGGVWSFQSKKQGQPLLPVFDAFNFEDRLVYIVYDSDAVTNPDVVGAELRLARRLTERGARVMIARLPADDQVSKVGLDDYIMFHGAEALRGSVLEAAFEYEASAVLHGLNERVLYVRDPGMIWEHEGALKLSPAAFKEHSYSNVHYFEKRVTQKGESLVKVPAAPAWLGWEHRATVPGLTFSPGDQRITGEGLLNLWTGWGVDRPREGDVGPWNELMTHLFGDATAERTWFERWCAAPLQQPGLKMATAAAIWGSVHGSGKTLVGHTLMRIYGRKHSSELKDAQLDDERAQWAENKQFVLADDITARNDRRFMRKLMTMITQKYMTLNPKYIPSYDVPDLINYYFTSNDPDALFMDDEDRRFWVWETLAGKFTNYRAFVAWRESDAGIAALWHYLLSLDMGDFDPQAPAPLTVGKASMILLGKSDLGAWVRELKDNAAAVLARAGMKGDLFSAKELHALYDPSGEKRASPNALARELKRAGFHPPATGSSLHLPDGSKTLTYAILNGDKWAAASWSDACKHYIAHRPASTWAPLKKGKFAP